MRSNDKWIEDAFESFFPIKKEDVKQTDAEQMASEFDAFFSDSPAPKKPTFPSNRLGDLYDQFFMTTDSTKIREMKTKLKAQEELQRKAERNVMWKEAFADARKVRETALANAKKVLDDAFKQKTLVVNLFAGPGAGKSTTAAGIFYDLKTRGVSCELVTEFAKDLTWEERHDTFKDQVYIFGKQYHRIFRLLNKVDVIITDSPVLLTPVYDGEKRKSLEQLAVEEHRKMWTYNVFLNRKKVYNPKGRIHDAEDAGKLDILIKDMLDKHLGDSYDITDGTPAGKDAIVTAIVGILNGSKVKGYPI